MKYVSLENVQSYCYSISVFYFFLEIARDYIHTLNLGSVVGGLVCPVHDAYGKKDLVPAHHR